MKTYTRVVGVATDVKMTDGKLEFEWQPTNNNIKNLIDTAKHPEKLFKYSPEYKPEAKSEDYPDGEIGLLKSIAITDNHMANDGDSITTWIKNSINKIKGEEMKDDEVKQLVSDSIAPFEERLKLLDKFDEVTEKIDGIDFDKFKQLIDLIPEIEKVEELEKNIKKISSKDDARKEELIKNIKTNGDMEDEEALEKMSLEGLEKLYVKFKKEDDTIGGTSGTQKLSIVEQINAKYGTNVGASLKK